MSGAPVTPDGRYIVVRGRLWRAANPALPPERKAELVRDLMTARRAVGVAKRAGDTAAEAKARRAVDAAKHALGERGPVWWTDGAPDLNRRMAKTTPYAGWFARLAADPNARPRVQPSSSRRSTMKLYLAPGACSLADHIALHAAGYEFEREKVDLKAKRTEHGEDYNAVNPKGYVPALKLDSGETLTENIAILDWIAKQKPALGVDGPLGETRLLETLAFISTEIHKSFKPFFAGGSDEDKAKAGEMIRKRMGQLAETMQGDFIFGNKLSVADCYLFVMLLWAGKNGIEPPAKLAAFRDRMMREPAVQTALKHEGLA